jgi:hypothetical protein
MADPAANQMQANLRDALTVLSADNDVLGAPAVTLVATGSVLAGQSVVIFNGKTGQSLGLPAANALGPNVAAIVVLLNVSTSAVTLFPSGADKIKGAASLAVAAGVLAILVSDGVSKWLGLP